MSTIALNQIYNAVKSKACGQIMSIGIARISGNTVEILVSGHANTKEELCLPDSMTVDSYTVIINYRRISGRIVPPV